jgi:serine/threonine-protein phosphatase 2B catalytic subunit
LLRGNHESRSVTEHFTFRNEVLEKYDRETYDLFMESFDNMPLMAVMASQYLGVHGGVSPMLSNLNEFNKIFRYLEIPSYGLICDLVWSDPVDDEFAPNVEYAEN